MKFFNLFFFVMCGLGKILTIPVFGIFLFVCVGFVVFFFIWFCFGWKVSGEIGKKNASFMFPARHLFALAKGVSPSRRFVRLDKPETLFSDYRSFS